MKGNGMRAAGNTQPEDIFPTPGPANLDPGTERLEKSGEGCAFEPNHRLPDLFGAFAGYGGTRQGVPAGVAPGSVRMGEVKVGPGTIC